MYLLKVDEGHGGGGRAQIRISDGVALDQDAAASAAQVGKVRSSPTSA